MPDPETPKQPRNIQDHDAGYKLLFGDPVMVRELLEDFAPPEIAATLDYSTLERLPAEHVDERTRKTRRDDLIWRVRKKDGSPCYVAIILEFQSRPDPFMALRILVYSGLLLQTLAKTDEVKRRGLPPLLPIVIYNGPGEWNAAEEVAELFARMDRVLAPFNPRQRYLPVKVMALPEEALTGRGIAAQVFRFEKVRDLERLNGLVLETSERFDAEKYANIRRIITGWLKSVLSVRFNVPADEIKGIDDLRGVSTMLAHNVDLWKAKCVQVGLVQGRAEGRVEGRAEGRVEGEARMARRMAADALVARFGAAPGGVMARLEAISDPEVLRRLGTGAWQAKSLEDFIALLPDGKPH